MNGQQLLKERSLLAKYKIDERVIPTRKQRRAVVQYLNLLDRQVDVDALQKKARNQLNRSYAGFRWYQKLACNLSFIAMLGLLQGQFAHADEILSSAADRQLTVQTQNYIPAVSAVEQHSTTADSSVTSVKPAIQSLHLLANQPTDTSYQQTLSELNGDEFFVADNAILTVIDPGIENWGVLADAVQAGEVLLLKDDVAPLEQIIAKLKTMGNVKVLNILSHGNDGEIYLSGQRISASNLAEHAQAFSELGALLTEDGQLQLFGCDVAKSELGKNFITELASLTGADVAGSVNVTGSGIEKTNQPSDWELEYFTGNQTIGIAQTFNSKRLLAYNNVLQAVYTFEEDGYCYVYPYYSVDTCPIIVGSDLEVRAHSLDPFLSATVYSNYTLNAQGTGAVHAGSANGQLWMSGGGWGTAGRPRYIEMQKTDNSDFTPNSVSVRFLTYRPSFSPPGQPVADVFEIIGLDSSNTPVASIKYSDVYDGDSLAVNFTNPASSVYTRNNGYFNTVPSRTISGSFASVRKLQFKINANFFGLDDLSLGAVGPVNNPPVNNVAPAISGTATVGNTLVSSTGAWTDADGDTLTYSYQWYRADDNSGTNRAAIAGATTDSRTLTTSDAHKYLQVVVTANDGNGGTQTATSAYTAIQNSAPVNSVVPTISGTATVGNVLSTTNGTWSDADGDSRTYSYQWYRADDNIGTNVAAIAGATTASYTLTTSDAHKHLRVVVTANDGRGGTQTASSVYVQVVNSAPTDITLSNNSIGQSATGVSVNVGTLTGTDPDNVAGDLTFSLVGVATATDGGSCVGDSGNGSFTISGTSLRTASTLIAGSYNLCVQVSDGSLSYKKDFTVTVTDDIAPVVSSVSVPASAYYIAGHTLTFTVNTSKNVIVDTTGGTPGIALTIGSNTRYATYTSGTGTSTLVFSYTVQAGDNDNDGISVGALGLNGGTVRDAAGNNMVLTLNSVGSTSGILVDTTAPTLLSLSPADNSLTVSPHANFVMTFSENINLGSGNIVIYDTLDTPVVTINVASHGGQLSVTNNQLTINPAIDLNEGTSYYIQVANSAIRDMAGIAYAGIANNSTWNFTVADLSPPEVTSIVVSGTPAANVAEMQFTVTFNEPSYGVSVDDFTLTSSNTASGTIASVTSVAGNSFSVTVNSISGTGTLRLDLKANTDITDGLGNGNNTNGYVPAFTSGGVHTVDRVLPQTITFNNPGAQNFGTTPTLMATSDSGLTPTFTSSTTGVCTITSGGVLTFVMAGTCTINANQAGDSSYLAATEVSQSFTVNAVVPSMPVIGTATPGNAQASVTFSAPASNGGAAITSYTVTSSPGDFTATGAGSPITVTGLTNGTAYTFTVTATNSAGAGIASQPSNSVTPEATNHAPVISGVPAVSVKQGTAYSFIPTATDPDGDTLTFSITNKPSWASFNAVTGALTGTPVKANVGVTTGIVISVSDGSLSASLPAFNLEVVNVNEAPVAVDDVFTLPFSAAGVYVLDVLANDSDPDGDTLSITHASTSIGTVAIADSALRFTAPENFSGTARLEYRISDGEFGAQAKVLLTIDGTNPLAPVISGVDDIRVNASGLFTKVDLGVITARDVNGNRVPVTLVNGAPVFKSGAHEALWQATDSNGVSSSVTQSVKVDPQVSTGKSRQVTNHSQVTVEVMLNGEAPDYPVMLPYTVAGTAALAEHDLSDGYVEITSGMRGSLSFNVFANVSNGNDKTIAIALDNSLNLARNGNAVITVTEANLAPEVVLTAEQQGSARLLVAKDGGEVRVVSQVTDPNGDNVSLSWSSEPVLVNSSSDATVFAFDPSSVSNGVYHITLVATDTAASPLSGSAAVLLVVRDSLPALGNEDSNGNLIPDSVEGLGDSNGNGIPDYLDPGFDCNVMVEQLVQSSRFLTEAEPGICISRGRVALESNSGGLELFTNQLQLMEPDTQARPIGGVFDFVLSGLPVQGDSYYFVVPQRAAIPEGAVYRKFTEADGWKNFVQNSNNQLFSAPGEQGYCPAPGDALWQPGLTIGHWCVQLLIEDGGPNDADGTVNGRIVDPGGVSVMLNGNTFPVAEDDSYSVMWNQMHVLSVLDNDSDADADTLTITSASALFGAVVISDDGQLLEYTPQLDYLGTDTVTYSISDGLGGSATAQASVSVYENRAPVVSGAYTATTNNNTAIELQVLSVVTDADGDTLTVTAASAQQGSVSIVNGQLIRYTSPAGYTGTDVVSFTVSDGRGGLVTGVANVTVTAIEVIRVDNKSSGGALGIIAGMFLGLLALCRRHKVSVLVAALVSLFSAATMADEQWSIEAQVGQSKARLSEADVARTLPAGAEILAYDRRDTSWGVGVNFRLAEKLWLQGHYVDLGSATVSIGGNVTDADAFHRAVSKHGALLVEGVKTGLAYSIAQSDSGTLSLQLQAGVFSWWGERESRQGSNVLKADTSDTDVYWGLQGAYRLTEKGGVTVGFNRYHLEGNKVDNISVGFRWYF